MDMVVMLGIKKIILFAGLFISLFYTGKLFAQDINVKNITLNDAVEIALANNPVSKNADLKVTSAKIQKHAIYDLKPTELNFQYGQINSPLNDKYFEIYQHFGSPLTYMQKNKYIKENIRFTEAEQKLLVKQFLTEVKSLYIHWQYQFQKLKLIKAESILFDDFIKLTESQYEQQKIDLLKKTECETQYADFQNQVFQAEQEYKIAGNRLKQLLFINNEIVPGDTVFELYEIKFHRIGDDKFIPSEQLNYYEKRLDVSKAWLNVERSKFSPELYGGYFNQELYHTKGFEGITIGITVPLCFAPRNIKVKEARLNLEMAKNDLEYQKFNLDKTLEILKLQLDKLFVQISYLKENVLVHADLLEKTAAEKYLDEAITYFDYMKDFSVALKVRIDYLEAIKQYNLTAIQLEFYVY